MAERGKLSKAELYFALFIGFIFIGVALWNWSHGFTHNINWLWFLLGLNRLLTLGREAFPQRQGVFTFLAVVSSFSLVVVAAYIAFRYFL